jgi:hypothetical protein
VPFESRGFFFQNGPWRSGGGTFRRVKGSLLEDIASFTGLRGPRNDLRGPFTAVAALSSTLAAVDARARAFTNGRGPAVAETHLGGPARPPDEELRIDRESG